SRSCRYTHTSHTFCFFFHRPIPILNLLSFPTRRSSDLLISPKSMVIPISLGYPLMPKITLYVCPCRFLHFPSYPCKLWAASNVRSEEHTSELQSRFDLVCRLLLEKKNNI